MRVLVTGGGTGGHLFPGIAFATGMKKRIDGCRVLFIGTQRQLDKQALSAYDFELDSIQCMGLKGMGITNRIRSIMQLPSALGEARRILARFNPDLVLGVGGYVTGPVLLAAKIKGCPVCIHEQNSVPGLANKMLSRIADRIFLSIPCKYPFPVKRTVLTGNPVRSEIIAASQGSGNHAAGKVTLLVLGGSQGAHRLNMLVLEAAERIRSMTDVHASYIHQTGKDDAEDVRNRYLDLGIEAQVGDFFKDMAEIYDRSDLVVSRAGATTLAELSVMGLPSLLIPYPYAADNHQETNALYFQDGGAAKMLPEGELSGGKLAEEIVSLLNRPDQRAAMSGNMKKMGKPEATDLIINECLALVREGKSVHA